MEHFVSTLDESCDRFVRRAVYVAPFYGYGWTSAPKDPAKEWNWVPASFHVIVVRFYVHRANRRGFVGKVDEAGHEFDGLWMVCMMSSDNYFSRSATIRIPDRPCTEQGANDNYFS